MDLENPTESSPLGSGLESASMREERLYVQASLVDTTLQGSIIGIWANGNQNGWTALTRLVSTSHAGLK